MIYTALIPREETETVESTPGPTETPDTSAWDEIYDYFDAIPALGLMDGILASCDYGVTKPDARLFEALYARFGLRPEECFFIDDMPRNIEGAAKTGMIGHCFADRDLDRLKEAMRACGVQI